MNLEKYNKVIDYIGQELQAGRLKQKDLTLEYIQSLFDTYPNLKRPSLWQRLSNRFLKK